MVQYILLYTFSLDQFYSHNNYFTINSFQFNKLRFDCIHNNNDNSI